LSGEHRLGESPTALEREQAHYDEAYGSYIPEMFAQPAVVQFRRYLIKKILRATGAGERSRVFSIGCGIGDTELLLAPHVSHITGVDLSEKAIAIARGTGSARGINNVHFVCGSWQSAEIGTEPIDIVIAIFFLHHLSAADLQAFPLKLASVLRHGGVFYALDPSARRLSGILGELLVPKLMKKYQSEDEHPLRVQPTLEIFRSAGFEAQSRWFDFSSTPLAGLFPSWVTGYRVGRWLDEGLTRVPLINELSSNFELVAINRRP
jgi:SAM-dependent methyltransferase